MSWLAGYALGLATLPVLVLVGVAWERWAPSGWSTHLDACPHRGPNESRERDAGGWSVPATSRWALSWRCTVITDWGRGRESGPCGGLWVRRWVSRVLPVRVLWPGASALVRRRQAAAREHERDADAAGVGSDVGRALRRLARETREGRHDAR